MNLNGVDLFKFLFSFAVVAIHAHLLDGQEESIVSALRIVENLACHRIGAASESVPIRRS